MTSTVILLLASGVLGLIMILILEQLVYPRLTLPWQRPMASFLLTAGLWFLLFTIVTVLLGRPIFSALILLALWLLLVFANNAKYEALKEPFLFQDYDYIVDLVKHPRLFLPFLGTGRMILVILGVIAAVALGFGLERAIVFDLESKIFVALSLIISITLLIISHQLLPEARVVPDKDIQSFGLVAFYCSYAVLQFKSKPELHSPFTLDHESDKNSDAHAETESFEHIIAVQSESFFDPRLLCPDIKPELGVAFDEVTAKAYLSGEVNVPAWGANTVRSEFAFLTGIAPASLGVHGFNPYRLIKKPTASLVSFYKERGYRTIAIHPYPASFYTRDRVYPLLGFDEFYDITHFETAERVGPYVSDNAITQVIETFVNQATQPLFIFVVTMENHGPLHLESISTQEIDNLFNTAQPESCRDLAIYLRHWKNSGHMAQSLFEILSKNSSRSGKLVWYGDHVPVMEQVYKNYGLPSGRTPYFIASTDESLLNQEKSLTKVINIEMLGRYLIEYHSEHPN